MLEKERYKRKVMSGGKLILFVLMFNVPVNNFSVMSGRSHRFLGFNQYSRELMCLAQEHNTVTLVGIEQYSRELMCLAQEHNAVTLVGIEHRTF